MKKSVLLIIVASMMMASCEKLIMGNDMQASAVNTFGYLWQQFDQQYSMFDVKNVDWNGVYDSLRPMVHDGMPADSLYEVCAAMLNTLQDGHVNLYASYDVSRADSLYYRFYTETDIDMTTVILNYLGINYHSTAGMAHSSLCDEKVIYIRYGSFGSGISVGQFRHIIDLYPNSKGMILDMRGNGGGSLSNIEHILKLMPSHGQVLYRSQIKNGPGHNDFGPLQETYAPQTMDEETFAKPVLVLVDKGCFSATSAFAICTQAYDNMWLMGDSTSGGLGLPTMGYLPNGWRYRMPVTRTIALDGNNYENGVPPDIYIRLDWDALRATGHDNIIDSACCLIINDAIKK